MAKQIALAFIPIFVAVDAIGVLPIYVSLTQGLKRSQKFEIIYQSLLTAMCLAVGFIFLGQAIFKFLKITIGDFMIAGGILLFIISLIDIINPSKKRRIPSSELGFVPLGTPLIVGPAVLTTSLIMLDEFGIAVTLIAVFINVLLAGIIFFLSDGLMRVLGVAGTRALSKITSLLLAAIAVMMIRKGLSQIIASGF